MKTPLRRLRALLAVSALAISTLAIAAYPEKPINVIVGYSAGGATDLLARAMAPYIEKSLGAKLVILNRAGAGGEIAFAALAAAPPDGYTIGLLNSPPVVTIPIERPGSFHWERLDLLGNLIDDPGAFVVNTGSSITNIRQLIAEAKKRPGAFTVGTSGTGSDDHLAMLMFEKQAGVKFNHIPFKGGADARAALVGKQIDMVSMNIGEGMQGAKNGMPFRNLGQMGLERADVAPDVPTFKELGFDIQMAALRGMAAPKGLPPDVREKLVKAVADAVNDPAFQARARESFNPIRYLAPREYAAELRSAEALYRQMWKESPWSDK
jgi:tripartite-type tricarboxylate transporter receptor subunit TctC